MIDKEVGSPLEAVAGFHDGATVLISGFGEAGSPTELVHALIDHGAKGLVVVSNNAGNGQVGLAALIRHRRVRKIICSFPRSSDSSEITDAYRAGAIEIEVVPQGTLAERIRAGGAGIPAFYTATGVGTLLSEGKPEQEFDGRRYVLERGLKADFALVKAYRADRHGNLVFRKTARNFGPIMCRAATNTIVQAEEIVEAGGIDPEVVVTPGVFVNRLVRVSNPVAESELIRQGATYP